MEYPRPLSTVAFRSARNRCTNPNNNGYSAYGGRGIEFRFKSFEEFFAELGPRPSNGHSLDRINNDGHYEAGNVRWETKTVQRRNQRHKKFTSNDILTIRDLRGQGMSLRNLAKRFDSDTSNISRITRGFLHPAV